MKCPECGSSELVKFGTKYIKDKSTSRRFKKQQYQCKACGRITINPKD